MMAAPLYDLTSLPSTLSTIPLSSPSVSSSLPSSSLTPLLASSPDAVEGGQQQEQEGEGEQTSKPPPSFLSLRSLRPGIRGLRGVQGDQVTAFLHSPQVGKVGKGWEEVGKGRKVGKTRKGTQKKLLF